jgi:hypothetical protein
MNPRLDVIDLYFTSKETPSGGITIFTMRPTMYAESIDLDSAVLANADFFPAVYGELLEQTSQASM